MNISLWRDLAVVFLALQCFIIMLIPLVIIYFGVRGMAFVNDRTPGLFLRVQKLTKQVRSGADRVSDQVAAPVARVQAEITRVETVMQRLTPDDEDATKRPQNRKP